MRNTTHLVVYLIIFFSSLSACSNRQLYHSAQTSRLNECNNLIGYQRDKCLEQSSKSYEQYQREREEVLEE